MMELLNLLCHNLADDQLQSRIIILIQLTNVNFTDSEIWLYFSLSTVVHNIGKS